MRAVLGTALLRVKNNKGIFTEALRALCDNGSQVNLITKECADSLGVAFHSTSGRSIIAAFGSPIKATRYLDVDVFNATSPQPLLTMRCYVIPSLPCKHPQQKIHCKDSVKEFQNKLADPMWYMPAKVDVLIGAGTMAALVKNYNVKLKGGGFQLLLQDSLLGLIISGEATSFSPVSPQLFHLTISNDDLDLRLRRLWEVNDPPSQSCWSPQEILVEENFKSTTTRDISGRYIISMAFRPDVPPLGLSRHIALKRFLALEARCKKQPELKQKVHDFICNYLESGHLVPIGPPPGDPSAAYYLPYHAIQNKKFRIVFDGSCASSTGISLNDRQFSGPKIQADLCEILLRFRTYRYALTADIVKMFRQIAVHETQWNFQRILWRPSDISPIQDYAITCVVWGLTSASYNAVRSLRQCALDHADQYPLASAATLTNFYVDDLLSGTDNFDELALLRKQLIEMLALGGFPLDKWATNHPLLAAQLGHNSEEERSLDDGSGVLGMMWSPSTDCLSLRLSNFPAFNESKLTKRQLISHVAQVYDPTGLFAPILVIGKLIIQDVWRLDLDWDALVPADIVKRYADFHSNVIQMSTLKITRWLQYSQGVQSELHVFSDASECAFGACAYLRTIDTDGVVQCRLIQSRNRVAPVKTQTIPRLELMGAQVAVELWQHVSRACGFESLKTTFWTDSMIVLRWLRRDLRSLKPFVANRVATILRTSSIPQWRHVPGISNPADLLSRGSTVAQLQSSTLWWNGPQWLLSSTALWPEENNSYLFQRTTELEAVEDKANFVGLILNPAAPAMAIQGQSLLHRSSKLQHLLKTTAFVLRFIRNVSRRNNKILADITKVPPISVEEREAAMDYWVREEQERHFRGEVQALQSKKGISATSTIKALCPYIGPGKIMKVGGRLQNANIPDCTKHPILLDPSSRLSLLIVRDAHHRALHAGCQLTMATVRGEYWIPRLRILCKQIISRCPICIRFRKETAKQLMGNLPAARVNVAQPFLITGIDFAGPFNLTRERGRPGLRAAAQVTDKAWVAVFVCLATRAIHLDFTVGLSVDAFLQTFARFTSRRGSCRELWSDNGTTFVGINKELRRIRKEWGNEWPHNQLANEGTSWKFITPGAPHQGGMWEAGVKAFKHHLKATIGARKLGPLQFYTVLTQIEACLNSRPIAALSDDPSDLSPLTPGHFLIGRPILQRPLSENVYEIPDNRLTMWGNQQKLTQTFWRRWHNEHLLTMQKRSKWTSPSDNIKVNDLVIMVDENLPPTVWPLARVSRTIEGPDGLVRNVEVKTDHQTTYRRPIQKLVPLSRIIDIPEN